MTTELKPLPLGKNFIDEDALDRMRFCKGGGRDGHDMGANWNTVWRLVETIDHYRRPQPIVTTDGLVEGFDPCPFCKQYSHSIGEDAVAKAFMHFQSLIAHPMRGHPMGEAFDGQTRDAAQVLTAKVQSLQRALTDARLFVELLRVHWSNWHDDPEQVAEAEDCLRNIDAALSTTNRLDDE